MAIGFQMERCGCGRCPNYWLSRVICLLPENRTATHPGQILLYEFLEPIEVSQSELARHLDISVQRINELIRGRRGVTPDTAW